MKADDWDPLRSDPVDKHHMLCRYLENGWLLVVEICDPWHWIDDEFWNEACGQNSEFKLDQSWAQLWQQDSLPKLRIMIDYIIICYARYIASRSMVGATDLFDVATALRSKHPQPFAGIDFVSSDKRGFTPDGKKQEGVVEREQGILKFRLPQTIKPISVDAWDAKRTDSFSLIVNEHFMQQQGLKERHEKSATLTFRLLKVHVGEWIGKGGCNIRWLQEQTETKVKEVSRVSGLWSVTGLGENCDRVVAYARSFEEYDYWPHNV